jgi:hypothetical protein
VVIFIVFRVEFFVFFFIKKLNVGFLIVVRAMCSLSLLAIDSLVVLAKHEIAP